MAYFVGALALVVAAEMWLLWRVGARLGGLDALAERVAHLVGALTLLTETNELGFQSLADEVGRGSRAAAARVTPAKAGATARKGQSVRETAHAGRMSEGEARLSLLLSGSAKRARAMRISKEA